MQNLRDKLLKAGLVSESDAQRAEQEKKAPKRPPVENRPREPGKPPERPAYERPQRPEAASRIPKLPPLALPGSKAFQRLEALKQQERDKALRELVYGSQVPVDPGATAFHFVTRKGKLRRLELTEAQAKLLEEGKLAVVERPEPAAIEHSLVPPETAVRMMALSEKAVRFFNREGKPVGFLSDDELKARESAEARGETMPAEDADRAEEPVAAAAATEEPSAG
jgi:hypothetical protein